MPCPLVSFADWHTHRGWLGSLGNSAGGKCSVRMSSELIANMILSFSRIEQELQCELIYVYISVMCCRNVT